MVIPVYNIFLNLTHSELSSGGGLGGLMLAYVLTHYITAGTSSGSLRQESVQFKIDIYESSPTFSTIGVEHMRF